jgi:hypothetical protein
MKPRRRRGKDPRHSSLVIHFLVFLSVSVLSLLVLDQEAVQPMANNPRLAGVGSSDGTGRGRKYAR